MKNRKGSVWTLPSCDGLGIKAILSKCLSFFPFSFWVIGGGEGRVIGGLGGAPNGATTSIFHFCLPPLPMSLINSS